MRRDRHPHERVRRGLQGAAASGLAEQLLAAAGGVSGQLVGVVILSVIQSRYVQTWREFLWVSVKHLEMIWLVTEAV